MGCRQLSRFGGSPQDFLFLRANLGNQRCAGGTAGLQMWFGGQSGSPSANKVVEQLPTSSKVTNSKRTRFFT
jgi:hypothetical protein